MNENITKREEWHIIRLFSFFLCVLIIHNRKVFSFHERTILSASVVLDNTQDTVKTKPVKPEENLMGTTQVAPKGREGEQLPCTYCDQSWLICSKQLWLKWMEPLTCNPKATM